MAIAGKSGMKRFNKAIAEYRIAKINKIMWIM